jgi:hypothetical protein
VEFTVSEADPKWEQARRPNRQEEICEIYDQAYCCLQPRKCGVLLRSEVRDSQVIRVDPEGTASSQLHRTHRLVLRFGTSITVTALSGKKMNYYICCRLKFPFVLYFGY